MKELNLAIEQLVVYLQGIWLRRRYIVITAWIICPIGWLIIFNMPPTFQADAKLYVETRSDLDPILQGLAIRSDGEQKVELMARTLLSRPNLEKIARATDLDLYAKDSGSFETLIDRLKENIKLSSSGRENIYVISYSNPSSKYALKVVQETLNTFIENQVGDAASGSKKASDFLETQIKDYERRLEEAEVRLSEFKKSELSLAPGSEQDFYSRINGEKERLDSAQLELRELESQLQSARKQLAGEIPSMTGGSGATSGFTTQYDERIKLLENQLDSLLIRFTDIHPDVVETRRLLESLQKSRTAELSALTDAQANGSASNPTLSQNTLYQELKLNASRLENSVESAKIRVANFAAKVEALERQRNLIPDIEARFTGLNRDYEITKAKYEELLNRREAIDLTQKADESQQDVQFKVIEPPRVPMKPSGPPRVLLYTAVLILGALAGIFMAFARSQLSSVVTSALQLKTICDFPVFGLVSHTNKPELVRQHKLHFLYFMLLSGVLVLGYCILITNELVFGMTASQLLERLL